MRRILIAAEGPIMHFEQTEEFEKFVKEKLFKDCSTIQEINTGGSSYNFMVKTPHKTVFLKLLNDKQRYLRLQTILQMLDFLCPLSICQYQKYYLLATPYIDGRPICYADMSDEIIAQWLHILQKIQSTAFPKPIILPQQNIKDVYRQVQQMLLADTSSFAHIINIFFWPHFKSGLIAPADAQNIIHGDMTVNNVLLYNNQPILVDFEAIRYGYPIEDIAALTLQLSGFRNLWGGNLKKFISIYNQVQKIQPTNNTLWLYGVQMFYLNRLWRRLRNISTKKRSWRRGICFVMSAYGYFKIEKFLRKSHGGKTEGLFFKFKLLLDKLRKLFGIIPHHRNF